MKPIMIVVFCFLVEFYLTKYILTSFVGLKKLDYDVNQDFGEYINNIEIDLEIVNIDIDTWLLILKF